MTAISDARRRVLIPRRQRHYSYDESLDEPAKLLADEPAELERETPTEENEPVESVEPREPAEPPVFED
jgi:hypothetical protein